jgi:salicylate hydroxylase
MMIEDAALLAQLFSHLSSLAQVDTLLRAFETLARRRRSTLSQLEARIVETFCHDVGMQHGEEQLSLLESLGMAVTEGKPEKGDKMRELVAYNAHEAAEEWWASEGKLHERAMQLSDDSATG